MNGQSRSTYFDYLAQEGVHEQLGASRLFYQLQGEDLQSTSTYLSKVSMWNMIHDYNMEHFRKITIFKCYSEMVLRIRKANNFKTAVSAFPGTYKTCIVQLLCNLLW